ncbi:MAG: ROK family protein [Halanaerobiales bacterium]
MKEYYIGVDLGGTKILTAIADGEGKIIARKKLSTEAEKGQEVIIKNIEETINSVLQKSGIKKSNVKKIGIGSPGPLSTAKGVIYETANLPWKNVPIVDIMEEKTGIPVQLENDANAAGLGEKWFGAGKGVDDLIYITVSTGVGGGIIIDKKALQGYDGAAGEIGHMTIQPAGPQCGCGNYGCLESFASGTAIAREGRKALKEDKSHVLKELSDNNPDKIDAYLVAQGAFKGDEVCKEIYNKAGYYLGIGIANLINIFNPEMIVMGGGVWKDEELLKDAMWESLEERALSSSLEQVEICKVKLGDDTGVKGAIAVAMEEKLLS